VQHFSFGEQGEGSLIIEVANLEVNPEIDAETFRMKLPKGYEQIDDFAP
jgi:outer membrane lipoprotein-sorting protein